jgi:hypothetical protein
MFDREALVTLLDLQGRSYALLRWITERVRAGTLRLTTLHGALDVAQAAEDWLTRNVSSLPPATRPPEGQLAPFAHLFASYLVTSFEVASTRRAVAACGCDLCVYLVHAPNLRARTPSARDRELAETLKLDTLETLAAEAEAPLLRDELAALLARSPELHRPLATVAYVRELARRACYRGQGGPVLALWRDVAWRGGRPTPSFTLNADTVMAAEAAICDALRAEVRGP